MHFNAQLDVEFPKRLTREQSSSLKFQMNERNSKYSILMSGKYFQTHRKKTPIDINEEICIT